MRRVVWSVLTGLGVFFLVLAALSKFLVPGQSIKFPLNEYSTTNLEAANASYFSPKFITEESGVTLRVTNTTKGDVAAAKTIDSSRVAVWQSYSAMQDITNHTPVSIPAAGNKLAFDRKTGALVPWSGNTVAGTHVDVTSNEQGSLFPLGTKKQDYQVFDSTLKKPVTFHYRGITATSGVATYVFVASVPSVQIGTESLPGSLVGMTASQVTLPEFYSAQETYFVDPTTGVPLSVQQNVHEVLQDNTGATRLVLLNADFQTTPASVAANVSTDNGGATKISLAEVTVPIVGLLLGVMLLIAGLVLSRSEPEDEEYEDDEQTVGVSA
jgi:hypothetical protein